MRALGLAWWCGRWFCVFLIAAAAIRVTEYPPHVNGPPIRADGEGYHVWTYAILKGDLSFSWFEGNAARAGLHQPDPAVRRFTCKYPPGVALLRLPVMVFVTDPGRNGPPYLTTEHWACLYLGAAALIAIAALGLDSCYRLGVAPLWANAAVFFLTFGTGLFHYGTYDASYSHIDSALLISALVWLALRAIDGGQTLSLVPVVVLTALLFLVRTTNILLIGIWVLGCISWPPDRANRSPALRVRALGGATLGLIAGMSATLAVNYAMFGRLTLHTYSGERFVWGDPKLLLVLSGENHGLFRLYPVLGVTIVVGLIAPRSRWWTIGLVLAIAAYTVLYGHWWTWHLASGFGHRGFVELVPLAVPALALALGSLRPPAAWGTMVLGGAATAYTLNQMWQYWHDRPYLSLGQMLAA